MGRGNYSREPENPTKSCKARGSDLRVHYKNTRETVAALKGMSLRKAQRYLEQVLDHTAAIPFRRHTGGIGRHAQAKMYNTTQCRWPKKSCEVVLGLLKNVESNAEVQGLAVNTLQLTHLQVQRAQKQRRRTYRAHGRINPYMAAPCHIEIIATEKERSVKKPKAGKTAVAPAS
eukprot:CAMPEP_0201483050 /NCGR_PEP_ID=MMETSP0151_2-20130828/7282_1 /ASSEMBLY_ACC=CAM_ASM_000257 /TAXON_ID=200890 /ORGANISM="Paramoeba atlantica, Strain 621/1 / CCAP 1560/9" /LENGTH=173 /DNA_ID=CAMNT_0047866009 /DNA_START=61 /DNA_END=582 /DNA_ORIENTATION=-